PSVPPAVTEARTYPVAPGSVTVQAGILVGEITEMQVTARVEQSAGRRVSRAKLTAALALTNSSASQSVRLVAGKIQYLDDPWRPSEEPGQADVRPAAEPRAVRDDGKAGAVQPSSEARHAWRPAQPWS